MLAVLDCGLKIGMIQEKLKSALTNAALFGQLFKNAFPANKDRVYRASRCGDRDACHQYSNIYELLERGAKIEDIVKIMISTTFRKHSNRY